MSLQPTVQQMLNNLYQTAFTNPSSPFYLPTVIRTAGFAPNYSAGNWDVGQLTGGAVLAGAASICQAWAPFPQNGIATPGSFPYLKLSQIIISNLDNVKMPAAPQSIGPEGLTITAQLVFNSISISGSFELTQSCCVSDDLSTCNPNTTALTTGVGTFTLTLGGQSTANASTHVSQIAPNVLTIVADSVVYSVDYSQMSATVDITNIQDPTQRATWNKQAETAFNDLGTQKQMVNAMNADLGGQGPLTQIGQQLTQHIDQYLQQTHQYPYDGGFAALFSR